MTRRDLLVAVAIVSAIWLVLGIIDQVYR